jgi:hypothetical protein
VQVRVEDRLPGLRTGVEDEAVAAVHTLGRSHLTGQSEDVGEFVG